MLACFSTDYTAANFVSSSKLYAYSDPCCLALDRLQLEQKWHNQRPMRVAPAHPNMLPHASKIAIMR